ncbi:hypothetical protein M3P05_09130 [Sansalvadorimonas sp. 2012CJ34-2]|uniref:Uncharacterized protein n=1 Tax=Parendozoicomonas callyspongiae TaxID=2942213 RepID=A0ABT0PFD9_9GAMM|nr:hypothetical protein [Sansalvadorimonas sp. 2012CJ34-2]MCL6270094.1 hypothetical protein [Sansalvadorimonas sp. 2012CJ34-2]
MDFKKLADFYARHQEEYDRLLHGVEDVISLILKEQREYQGRTEYRLEKLEQGQQELRVHIDQRFSQLEGRFDQLEFLMRQHFTNG